ncbi:MAG TPA: ECF-type sigma factor [Dokdonella sp.]|uniref:ECF-type sigma factor n=1 Tax=Dokdonella sp. TaxID=2291710 RepID=UPI002D801D9C|nr:ECF-type sigma factor [Dokdonella sp.]HET9032028.1 ECF-type sigma factor [Dokdonella sp.]
MNAADGISPEDTLGLVQRCANGDEAAYNQLFQAIYEDLRRRAHLQLSGRRDGTMSTTLLVHETYLKLAGTRLALNDRAHFFAIAARAMRQILINAARDRAAQKRGGDQQRVTFDQSAMVAPELSHDLLGLDAAMKALEANDARLAQVVELHFFAGLDFARIAELLGLSERTVARDWRAARAMLRLHLETPP